MTAPAPELVECAPYGVRLTVAGCAQRFGFAPTLKWVRNVGSPDNVMYGHCLDCAAGKERAALVQITPKSPRVARLRGALQLAPAPAPARVVDAPQAQPPSEGSAMAMTYEWNGEQLTIEQLSKTPEARKLELSGQAIRSRIEKGWSAADAITIPKARRYARDTHADIPPPPAPPKIPPASETLRKFRGVPLSTDPAADNRSALDPVETLRVLGFKVEVLGRAPRGLLVLIEGS